MSRSVAIARLHSAAHMSKAGSLGPVINDQSIGKDRIKMLHIDGGLLVEDQKSKVELFIPYGNIVSLEYVPPTTPPVPPPPPSTLATKK